MPIQESPVHLVTQAGPMQAFLALPESGRPAPAVIVIQEAFGVNANTKEVCLRLAREGYVALAPELFHRTAPAGTVFEYDFSKVQSHFARLANQGIAEDIAVAKAHLTGHPRVQSGSIGIVGFCLGGFAAFLGACESGLQAAAAFYGGGIVRPRPGLAMQPLLGETPSCPLLCLFGGKDPSIPMSDIDAVRERLARVGNGSEVIVYPEAGHAFFNSDRPGNYNEAAAKDAWPKLLEFFAKRLGVKS
jgi:carboxymethylenebutenolidase